MRMRRFVLGLFCICASLSALFAWRLAEFQTYLASDRRTVVRIELPKATEVTAANMTNGDAAVLLRMADLHDANQGAEAHLAEVEQKQAIPAQHSPRADAESQPLPTERVAKGGLLAIAFDLAATTDSIELRKRVQFNGEDAGSATIRVDSANVISVASWDLQRILADYEKGPISPGPISELEFIRLDDVRKHGWAISYDPVSDRLLVSG